MPIIISINSLCIATECFYFFPHFIPFFVLNELLSLIFIIFNLYLQTHLKKKK